VCASVREAMGVHVKPLVFWRFEENLFAIHNPSRGRVLRLDFGDPVELMA